MTNIFTLGFGAAYRPKLRPRGRPFKKGERHTFQFQPGQSGNPGGKPKLHQHLSAACIALLPQIVPAALAAKLGIRQGITWADAIAEGMIKRAVGGDIKAAKEIREATEGSVP